MKNLLILLFIFISFKSAFSQDQGMIRYKVLSGLGWNSYSKLIFSQDQSLYVLEDPEDKIVVNEKNMRASITHEYIKYHVSVSTKTGIKQKLKGANQLVRTEFPITLPAWKIQTETRNIKGYLCTKATTILPESGKTEVWFSSSIPARVGPPTFWGLPGLILEIKCENGLEFIMDKLELRPVKPEEIQLTEGKLVASKEYSNSKSKVQSWAEKTNKAMEEGDK